MPKGKLISSEEKELMGVLNAYGFKAPDIAWMLQRSKTSVWNWLKHMRKDEPKAEKGKKKKGENCPLVTPNGLTTQIAVGEGTADTFQGNQDFEGCSSSSPTASSISPKLLDLSMKKSPMAKKKKRDGKDPDIGMGNAFTAGAFSRHDLDIQDAATVRNIQGNSGNLDGFFPFLPFPFGQIPMPYFVTPANFNPESGGSSLTDVSSHTPTATVETSKSLGEPEVQYLTVNVSVFSSAELLASGVQSTPLPLPKKVLKFGVTSFLDIEQDDEADTSSEPASPFANHFVDVDKVNPFLPDQMTLEGSPAKTSHEEENDTESLGRSNENQIVEQEPSASSEASPKKESFQKPELFQVNKAGNSLNVDKSETLLSNPTPSVEDVGASTQGSSPFYPLLGQITSPSSSTTVAASAAPDPSSIPSETSDDAIDLLHSISPPL